MSAAVGLLAIASAAIVGFQVYLYLLRPTPRGGAYVVFCALMFVVTVLAGVL